MSFINPIDKDKVAENPGLLAYPHTLGSSMVKPGDQGKIKSRALSAMEEQTHRQLQQIQRQAELLAEQANAIRKRMEVSYQVYRAAIAFEPFIGGIYYLYEQAGAYKLMMIGPEQWGRNKNASLQFISTVKLLSDHTWEIIDDRADENNRTL